MSQEVEKLSGFCSYKIDAYPAIGYMVESKDGIDMVTVIPTLAYKEPRGAESDWIEIAKHVKEVNGLTTIKLYCKTRKSPISEHITRLIGEF